MDYLNVDTQAGHRSIESTRLYVHLSNDWLAAEYLRAATLIDNAATASRSASSRVQGCTGVSTFK